MRSWQQFADEVPGFAAAAERAMASNAHLTMATLRADGSPRICGTEIRLAGGHLYVGGMTGNRRFTDLRRDPRVAIHSGAPGGPGWAGDAKLSGIATEVHDQAIKDTIADVPPGPFELFVVQLSTVTVLHLAGDPPDQLVIETWHPGRPIERQIR
jgi:hypothetical protein